MYLDNEQLKRLWDALYSTTNSSKWTELGRPYKTAFRELVERALRYRD